LSSVRAAFAPGGGGELQGDPALEPSEVGGHTLPPASPVPVRLVLVVLLATASAAAWRSDRRRCLMLDDLGTPFGIIENRIGFICILLLRALIVPSTVKRTLPCGVLLSGLTILSVALGRHRFDDRMLSWITMMGFSIN
jgi:hypothetical protein